MQADERALLGPFTSRVVAAVKDYVQAVNSPNGHPFAAAEALERQVNDLAVEILRQARAGLASPIAHPHSA